MAITLEQMTVAFAKMVEMQTDLLEKNESRARGRWRRGWRQWRW